MGLQVGDVVFDTKGRPAVIVDRNAQNESVQAERQGENFEAGRRRNFINGLNPKERETYNAVIDEITEKTDPQDKLRTIMDRIAELKPDPRNHIVTRYLEAQAAHVMNSEKINPRVYSIDEDSVR